MVASQGGKTEAVVALVLCKAELEAKEDYGGETALAQASCQLRTAAVNALVEHGAQVRSSNFLGKTPLHSAVQLPTHLLRNEDPQKTVDIGAVIHDHRFVVEVLIKYGADVNALDFMGETLIQAAYAGVYNPDYYADVKDAIQQDSTDLILENARKSAAANAIILLVENGAKANTRNKTGQTPLFFFASAGQVPEIDRIINQRADVNLIDHHGNSPIFIAVMHGQKEAVESLVQHHCNVNHLNLEEHSLLHIAIQNENRFKTIIPLILGGLNLNSDINGWTPLFYACRFGHVEAIKLLMERLSDAMARDA
jgi:ankyrin repeat protein